MKAYWFAQNQKRQPLVAQVRRLLSLRKGDSLKVGQPAPLSSRMIGQPLSYWRKGLRCFHLLYKVKAGKALGVILRFSTRCYLTFRIFPPDSIIQDHLPVARHSVQDPIWYTCILSIVRTNKDIKQHHFHFIPDYRRHLVTWHLAVSHTLHICVSVREEGKKLSYSQNLVCLKVCLRVLKNNNILLRISMPEQSRDLGKSCSFGIHPFYRQSQSKSKI